MRVTIYKHEDRKLQLLCRHRRDTGGRVCGCATSDVAEIKEFLALERGDEEKRVDAMRQACLPTLA